MTKAKAKPPGEYLKAELTSRGWTQKDLAHVMGRPEQAISEIIRGKKQITVETAVELGAALRSDPRMWIVLETTYRLMLLGGGKRRWQAIWRRGMKRDGIKSTRQIRFAP